MSTAGFPFAAVMGQPGFKLALMLSALDTRLGGVLVSGPRGSAKSTLARGLADLLPDQGARFVTLPLGADEAQLTGTLDLSRALGEREVAFSPGLLSRAHEGVLYIDEVNLLSDALVDLLLDVAASGINHVERDGISHRHPADFLLIGTMNPDEGELRPQLLDRFGLAVLDPPAPDIEQRMEIVERRLAFDRDPQAFQLVWQNEQQVLRERLYQARARLLHVTLPPGLAREIATRCAQAQVEGIRADLAWRRGALAHAAWQGRDEVNLADIDALETLVMAHRAPQWLASRQSEETLSASDDHASDDSGSDNGDSGNGTSGSGEGHSGDPVEESASSYQGRQRPPSPPERPDLSHPSIDNSQDDTGAPESSGQDSGHDKPGDHSQEHKSQDQPPLPPGDWGAMTGESPAISVMRLPEMSLPTLDSSSHRHGGASSVRGRHPIGRACIDWPASLRLASRQEGLPGSPEMLQYRRSRRTVKTLECIVLDISGSSLSRSRNPASAQNHAHRLEQAMTVSAALAHQAYLARHELMLVTLGGKEINEVITPRRAPRTIMPWLDQLEPGGGTPLRQALLHVQQRLVKLQRQGSRHIRLWLLTDARCRDDFTVAPFNVYKDTLPDTGIRVIDCATPGDRLGRALELAHALDADYQPLDTMLTPAHATASVPADHSRNPSRNARRESARRQ